MSFVYTESKDVKGIAIRLAASFILQIDRLLLPNPLVCPLLVLWEICGEKALKGRMSALAGRVIIL